MSNIFAINTWTWPKKCMMCQRPVSNWKDAKCIEVGQKLESTIFDLVKTGVKTKDIGGNASTTEFTKQITDNL